MTLSDIFSSNGFLAKKMPGYEHRQEQIAMAERIEQAILKGEQLVVEAGTGVGKSLAYLTPFLLWAIDKKKRVVVSTYTKTLQHQLLEKDLPAIKHALGLEFKAELCLGQQNYLCLRRFEQTIMKGLFLDPLAARQSNKLEHWVKQTATGIKSELEFAVVDELWESVCRFSDLCSGKNCPKYSICFYWRARRAQFAAQLLIVNHHLYFANLMNNEMLLPKYDAVVFDEAHNLEDVATDYLGITLSSAGTNYLLSAIYNPRTNRGLLNRLPKLDNTEYTEIQQAIADAQIASDTFFTAWVIKLGQPPLKQRLTKPYLVLDTLQEPMKQLGHKLQQIAKHTEDIDDKIELEAYAVRCSEIADSAELYLAQPDGNDSVYWVEIEGRRNRINVTCRSAPIHIGPAMQEKVWNRVSPIIFTSATLATDRTFIYFRDRLGLNNVAELLLDSPFDYANNVLLYTNRSRIDPALNADLYVQEAVQKIKEILLATQGKAFVLFTSYKMLDNAYDLLAPQLPQFKIMRQGDAGRERLLKEFRKDIHSVLFATSTFWQGVDVPGEALQCVIIARLPFDVPDEPIIEARIQRLREEGQNPFFSFQVPQAIIMFKQGFGRLIRNKTDIGVVAILDPRLLTKSYGRLFLNSLPKCRNINHISEINAFLQKQ
ncbi:MAG: ATP-dependent DNA helicase [bacterium]|nr:ATP-dependent DNA helicase [bacterium]